MEANATIKEDLRSQKSTNILIGYVLALAAMFVAFEYTQREVKVVEEDKIYDYRMEEDMIPITQQQEMVAPPPAAAPTVMEFINEVEDDTELPEEEVETTEETNQAITAVVGTGAPSAAIVTGPVGERAVPRRRRSLLQVAQRTHQVPQHLSGAGRSGACHR